MTRSLTAALARLLLAGAALVAGTAQAALSLPPAPTRWVTDTAAFLSDGARQELDLQLENYEQQSGHHVLVWIGQTTGGAPIDDFAVRAFAAWHVGRKGLDDGLVLFVLSDDRQVRIEVGYGLEGQVPDAIAARIVREAIIPRIQAGDRDGAIRAGVAASLAAIDGRPLALEPLGSPSSAPSADPALDRRLPARRAPAMGIGQKVLIGLLVLGFLVLLVTNPSLALYLLFSMLSGGRGGGGGGSGGGYSGGGGRSGGGGASGSW